MNKITKKILLTLLLLVLIPNISYASALGIVNCTDGLRVRTSIDTSSTNNILTSLALGDKVTVLNTNAGSNNACSMWYQVSLTKGGKNYTGYLCGEFITLENTPNQTTSDNTYVKSNYDNYVDGDGTIACYEDTADWIYYQNPGGGATTGVRAKCGDVVKINKVKEYSSGTCRYWYNLTNKDGASGWLCGYYVSTNKLSSTAQAYYNTKENLNNYYTSLKNKGFPESYLPYLAEIHARHPNWIFEAQNLNIDFGEAVAQESYSERSLLQKLAFDENYLSTRFEHYNYLTNTFKVADDEDGWHNASTEAIAFYMDPRNYLNEKYIFALKSLKQTGPQDLNLINKILNPMGVWNTVYASYGGTNVGTDVVNASTSLGIDSVHIASRIFQEMNTVPTTDPRLGGTFNYNGQNYSGYYNFYNIAVAGNNKILNGMLYAMNKGWNTPSKAIAGGIQFLKGYVDVGQTTLYYERFDVSTNDGNYTHQYMSNLQAPIGETNTAFKTYAKYLPVYLESAITFTIPVYQNMPAYAVTSPKKGNPNNYLKDLTINGTTISGFSYDTTNYEITLPKGTSSLNVGATPAYSKTTLSGVGTITLNNTDKITIIATSGNTKRRTYTINIKYEGTAQRPSISELMNSSGVKYNNENIYGITTNSSASDLITNIKNKSFMASANIYDKNGNTKNTGTLKTGDTLEVSNGAENKKYQVVLYGDVNGDGNIDKLDYLAVLRMYYGYTTYGGAYYKAADANRDGKVDKLDYLAILREYYGYSKINQY